MTREEKIEYLAKAVVTLSELGDGKTAYVLNEIRLEMKSQLELPETLDDAAEKYREYRENCGINDPIMLGEIADAYYAGAEWGAGNLKQ